MHGYFYVDGQSGRKRRGSSRGDLGCGSDGGTSCCGDFRWLGLHDGQQKYTHTKTMREIRILYTYAGGSGEVESKTVDAAAFRL